MKATRKIAPLLFSRPRRVLLVLMAASAAACVSPSEASHRNFLSHMSVQVGKGLDTPELTRNRYPERQVSSRKLSNGNTEEEFAAGYKLRCRVFFEADNTTRKIVGWRYEGSREDCSIAL